MLEEDQKELMMNEESVILEPIPAYPIMCEIPLSRWHPCLLVPDEHLFKNNDDENLMEDYARRREERINNE